MTKNGSKPNHAAKKRTVHIQSTDKKGWGVGATDTGGTLAVPYTIPGETVEVEKLRKDGKLLSIVTPSDARIESQCQHFGVCGGCSWQHIEYNKQLQLKRQSVIDRFRELNIDIAHYELPIEPSSPFHYRNRMDYVWWPGGSFGLRERGKWRSIVDLQECHLLPDDAFRAASEINVRASMQNLPIRDQKARTPGLRYLIVRAGIQTHELMLCFVTDPMELDPSLWKGLDHVASVYQLINDNPENDDSDGVPVHLTGRKTYREMILQHTFEIGPRSFFQPNPAMAERMVSAVCDWIDERLFEPKKLVDLYCGVGVFAVCLKNRFRYVTGIESSVEAIRLARKNAGKQRIHFYAANANGVHRYNMADADVLLVDPPREGLMPPVLKQILLNKPRVLIYVSCNPRKGVEDIAQLQQHYRIDTLRLFDQFPQTPHVEMIAFMIRN